jgi:hypothetical protein
MRKLETTTDCIRAAEALKEEAKQVTTRESHVAWWDRKVDVLRAINEAFETGFFTGQAYDELWMAKHILYKAEEEAGKRAQAHQGWQSLKG